MDLGGHHPHDEIDVSQALRLVGVGVDEDQALLGTQSSDVRHLLDECRGAQDGERRQQDAVHGGPGFREMAVLVYEASGSSSMALVCKSVVRWKFTVFRTCVRCAYSGQGAPFSISGNGSRLSFHRVV